MLFAFLKQCRLERWPLFSALADSLGSKSSKNMLEILTYSGLLPTLGLLNQASECGKSCGNALWPQGEQWERRCRKPMKRKQIAEDCNFIFYPIVPFSPESPSQSPSGRTVRSFQSLQPCIMTIHQRAKE